MSELFVSLALKSTVVLFAGCLARWLLRRHSAATRHLAWTASLACALALPLLTTLFPAWGPSMKPAPIPVAAAPLQHGPAPQWLAMRESSDPAAETAPDQSAADAPAAPADAHSTTTLPAATVKLAATESPSRVKSSPGEFDWSPLAGIFIAVWACGAVIGFALLFGGLASVWQLQRGAVPAGEALHQRMRSACQELGLTRPVQLLIGHSRIVPMTWGWMEPVVLLPETARDWSPGRLRCVLLHELSHVKRWDCLTQFVGQLARVVYWFHPLTWVALAQQRAEQEQACDDSVLSCGTRAEDYAEQLLTVTAGLPETYFASTVALAMGRASRIERRLSCIMDGTRLRAPINRRRLLTVALCAAAGTFGLATFAPVSAKSSAPQASAPQAEVVGENDAARDPLALKNVVQGLQVAQADPKKDPQPPATPLELSEIQELLTKSYTTTDKAALTEAAIRGMLQSLNDPYAELYSGKQLTEFKQFLDGKPTGIGAQLAKEKDQLVVVEAMAGSPAEAAGVKSHDVILAVDGESAAGVELPALVSKIRGPAGTVVKVRVRHKDGAEAELSITRGPIVVSVVKGLWRDDKRQWRYWLDAEQKLAYINILEFNPTTLGSAQEVLKQLKQQGLKGLVLDLRGCPGGLLPVALQVVGLFQKEGELLKVKGKEGEQTFSADDKHWEGDFPLVVLIDGSTASAGEVVAGALQERSRAVLVGDRTFGKGSIQQIINVDDQRALKVTVAEMTLPSGRKLQRSGKDATWGIDPTDGDYVPLSAEAQTAWRTLRRQRDAGEGPQIEKLTPETIEKELADPQLAAAVKALASKISTGEFAKVGQPLTALVAHQSRLKLLEQQREQLLRQLKEVEHELGTKKS